MERGNRNWETGTWKEDIHSLHYSLARVQVGQISLTIV